MFKTAELGRSISKEQFESQVPELRGKLLQAQFALRPSGGPVVIIISGVDGAGKGEVVHRLNEWLDPRDVETHALWDTTDEEEERPPYWRFWRRFPARGRIGILFGSWYTAPIVGRVAGELKKSKLELEVQRIISFERMLTDSGIRLVKLWFHLSKKNQEKRLRALEKDPQTRWRVQTADWKRFKKYDDFAEVSEHVLQETDSAHAPWHVIESTDDRYRDITAARLLLASLEQARERPSVAAKAAPKRVHRSGPAGVTILGRVDLKQTVAPDAYRKELDDLQTKLNKLTWEASRRRISTVLVFEGWDAAGKGSAIRRVTAAIDPRLYQVVSIAAPTDEERAHHYLWRFWRHLPRAGRMTIFDRSWYGRVLVERIEGFAREEEWQRAFPEINQFEEQMTEHGSVVQKFWIHISKDEQLRRFRAREVTPYKRHKITDEDWRNREKWGEYELAVNDMVERTSSAQAPWTLVAGNDKKFARLQILRTLCRALKDRLRG